MHSRTREKRTQVTLARALSKLGVASRSQAESLIREGRVRVDGKPAHSPAIWVDIKSSQIAVDEKSIRPRKKLYFAFHKPKGVVTTRSDEKGRRTVYEFVPRGSNIFPVGRLDKDTSGLLLLTNDTRFGESITNPESGISKTYGVRLDKALQREDIQILQAPMMLADRTKLKPASVQTDATDPSCCTITIHEGKNRQVRRMFAGIGYEVMELTRLSIGEIRLGNLREGELRPLTADEIRTMLRKT